MPVSRQRKKPSNRKQLLKKKITDFNNQKLTRIMESHQPQLPPVRQFPSWKENQDIIITGKELQFLSDFMDQASNAMFAYQNIINRGLIDGTIELKHEKLNEDGTAYVPMSEEEAAPYRAEFQSLVKQAKEIAEQAKVEALKEQELAESQKDLPRIDAIVDPTGQPAEGGIITKI